MNNLTPHIICKAVKNICNCISNQLVFTCSKSTMETPGQCVRSVQAVTLLKKRLWHKMFCENN